MKNNMMREEDCPPGLVRFNEDVQELETMLTTLYTKHNGAGGRNKAYRMEKLIKVMCSLVISRRVKRPSYRDFIHNNNYTTTLRSDVKYGKLFVVLHVVSPNSVEVWGQPIANLLYPGPVYPVKIGDRLLKNLKGWRLF